MPFVSRTKKTGGNKGLAALFQGIQQGLNVFTDLKQHEDSMKVQLEDLNIRKQQAVENQKNMQQARQAAYGLQFQGNLARIAEDPENADLYVDQTMKFAQDAGIAVDDPNKLKLFLKKMPARIGESMKVLNQTTRRTNALMMNPDKFTDEQKSAIYAQGIANFDAVINSTSFSRPLQKFYMDSKNQFISGVTPLVAKVPGVVDTAGQGVSSAELGAKVQLNQQAVGSDMQGNAIVGTPMQSVAPTKYQEEEMKHQSAGNKVLDEAVRVADQNDELLDQAMRLQQEGTESGGSYRVPGVKAVTIDWNPFVGKDKQQLSNIFKQLQVGKIIATTKEAGARSADSEKEGDRITGQTLSFDNDPEVNRRLALFVKSQNEALRLERNFRKEYGLRHGNLDGYEAQAPLRDMRSYANLQTGEVRYIKVGDSVPKGFQAMYDILGHKKITSASQSAREKLNRQSNQPPLKFDANYLNALRAPQNKQEIE